MTEKVTGNAQPGACVDVLPRCSLKVVLENALRFVGSIFAEENSLQEPNMYGEQSSLRVNFFV